VESKSVILFIFEGVTEKIALENILKKIFSSNHVDVEFIGSDITSDNNISRADIENELRNFVRDKIKPLHIDLSDIQQIVHVIDTDGGFVDSQYIKYDDSVDRIAYTNDFILSKNPSLTLKRNKEKTDMAFDFAIKFQGREKDFITLVNDSIIKVPGTFQQTWSFIQKDNNSLHRYSNFHIFFNDVK